MVLRRAKHDHLFSWIRENGPEDTGIRKRKSKKTQKATFRYEHVGIIQEETNQEKIMNPFEKLYHEARNDPYYWSAGVTHSFAIEMTKVMKMKNVSKTDLAKKVGVSKAYVTKILKGDVNFTVETMVKFAMAVGCVIEDIKMKPMDADDDYTFIERKEGLNLYEPNHSPVAA